MCQWGQSEGEKVYCIYICSEALALTLTVVLNILGGALTDWSRQADILLSGKCCQKVTKLNFSNKLHFKTYKIVIF